MIIEGGRDLLERLNGDPSAMRLSDRDVFFLPRRDGSVLAIDLRGPLDNRETLITSYWYFHPRYQFFKTLEHGAHVADFGAGSGGLTHWRSWGWPDRRDLNMYAVDLIEGEFFDQYVDFDIVDLCIDQVKYPGGCFDAAICSHLIDHVADSAALVSEIARVVRPGAKVYIEWLNANTQSSLCREDLVPYGIIAGTMQFGDDGSHTQPLLSGELGRMLDEAGFTAIREGVITNDFLYPKLLHYGFLNSDLEVTTIGLWLAMSSVRYIILERS